jgi:hypothetical protein
MCAWCSVFEHDFCTPGLLLGFKMLLGLKPGHAYDPVTCLSGGHSLLRVPPSIWSHSTAGTINLKYYTRIRTLTPLPFNPDSCHTTAGTIYSKYYTRIRTLNERSKKAAVVKARVLLLSALYTTLHTGLFIVGITRVPSLKL